MAYTREQTVALAMTFVGAKKGSAKHKELVNTFNKIKPHGEVGNYSCAWCAITVTAILIKAGYTPSNMPMSYSCSRIISDAKRLDVWVENDAFHPSLGDLVLYDWCDSGKGDNSGASDHVGMVCEITTKGFKVVEGNKGSASEVGIRTLSYNARYIRGFCHLRYQGSSEKIGKLDVDGSFGVKSIMRAQQYFGTPDDGIISGQNRAYKSKLGGIVQSCITYDGGGSQLIKAIQKLLKVKEDGVLGAVTVKALQKMLGITQDGSWGTQTSKRFQMWLNDPKEYKPPQGNKIGIKANELAYSGAPSEAKYPSGHPTSAYKAALNKVYPDRSKWGKAPKVGASCDVFVGTVVKSCGIDSKFPRGLDDQQPYLAKSTKFQCVVSVTNRDVKKSELHDGDIITYRYNGGSGHIMIYHGGKAKHAALNKWYGRTTAIDSRLKIKGKKWIKVYRVK